MFLLDEKKDWAEVLKYVGILEGAASITVAFAFLLKALSDSGHYGNSESYLIFSVAILICGVVAFVVNMSFASVLYNLQEIRKAVTKEETEK
ncbi:hypothetical protein ACPW7J_09430 [Ihubacter sp. rT4E-8]|uniref:hypothetical protein n=1 Tax=Ihubacter sp. rT4E-8 TaxID=3242369 RepID=UPI003CF084E8